MRENPLLKQIRLNAKKRFAFGEGISIEDRFPHYRMFLEESRKWMHFQEGRGKSGFELCETYTFAIDLVVENLFRHAMQTFTVQYPHLSGQLTLLAIGGYGRKEMAPYSDIDILFFYSSKIRPGALNILQDVLSKEVIYPLWDLKFKVGHSLRNLKSALNASHKDYFFKNALLEARYLCGAERLFFIFEKAYRQDYLSRGQKKYILHCLKKQAERRANQHDTVFLQEPNIKNGVGGLRDYQGILWMARVRFNLHYISECYEHGLLKKSEYRRLKDAYDFLLKTRNVLHGLSGRGNDILYMEYQADVAERLGYKQKSPWVRIEKFLQDYYLHAKTIARITFFLEKRFYLSVQTPSQRTFLKKIFKNPFRKKRHKELDGFYVQSKTLRPLSKNVFKENPARLIRIFRHAQCLNLQIGWDSSQLIRDSLNLIDDTFIHNVEANRAFRAILSDAGNVFPFLEKMFDLGVLERFIPEFGKLVCLVQHEYYHRYTVDVHTLQSIRILDQIFSEKKLLGNYRRALNSTRDPTLLYVMLFVHDMGKSVGVEKHAAKGEYFAFNVFKRLGMNPHQREQVLFIVRNHLEMVRFWQKHDIDDVNSAQVFGDFVKTVDCLRYLYVHSYCDAMATSEELWNAYREMLHSKLYDNAKMYLKGQREPASLHLDKEMLFSDVTEQLASHLTVGTVREHFDAFPDHYFLQSNVEELVLHIGMIEELKAKGENPIVCVRQDLNLSLGIIDIVSDIHPKLFSSVAGAISATGSNILSSRVIARKDDVLLFTFYISSQLSKSRGLLDVEKQFKSYIFDAFSQKPKFLSQLAKKRRREKRPVLDFSPRVDIFHDVSLKRTIVQIEALDRIGLLYKIYRAMEDMGLQVTFSRISTECGIAQDTFYVEGKGIDRATHLVLLQKKLHTILSR